jgi:hypothetical protein
MISLASRWFLAALAAAGLAVWTDRAAAAPEEIQVYEDDLDKPGQFGLDVHVNDVFQNDAPPDYPGEQPSLHRLRVTPEFSYGWTPNLELGLYLPLATLQGDRFDVGGSKVRIKFIAPKPATQAWYWGANFEIGYQDHLLDINPWNAELKGIVGWRGGPWDVAFNTNLDWAVAGPDRSPANTTVQFATKVSYKVVPNWAVGVESYDGVGSFQRFPQVDGAGHSIYATVDTSFGLWDLNLGIGRGYSGEPDQWILKFIVGVPIDD